MFCERYLYFTYSVSANSAVCLFEQKTSDVAFSPDNDDLRRGFIAARMLPSDQGLLCITADQQFLFYSLVKHSDEVLDLSLHKRLIGYNEEIVDMKFLGEDEKFLAVATNLEQVYCHLWFYLLEYCHCCIFAAFGSPLGL